MGSTWGVLATGLFASKAINSAGNDGLLFGNPSLIGIQALSIVSVWVYSFAVTWIILKVLDRTMGLRVSEEHEINGLDTSQHGEVRIFFLMKSESSEKKNLIVSFRFNTPDSELQTKKGGYQ